MRKSPTITSFVLGAALLVACGGSPDSSAASPAAGGGSVTASATSSTSMAAPAFGACANPYQPVAEGDTWSYSISSTAGETSYTDTITSVGASSFTMSSEFQNLTREAKWSCTDAGLVALTFGGGVSGSLTSQDLSATFRTTKVTGVTIPASPEPGDTWQQSYGINGTIKMGGTKAKAMGTVTYDFRAGKTVSVNVPAGTFDALAVDTTIDLDLQAGLAGMQAPVRLTFGGMTYLAQGVGVVKATSNASLFGQSMRSTIELTDYSVE